MKKILIVDDETSTRKLVKEIIKVCKKEVEIEEATNGKEALEEKLKLNMNEFELIISDIKMPVMNGIEMLKEIRKSSQIPIILMSGANSDDLKKFELNGMENILFLPKPFLIDNFIQLLKIIGI
jgi:two-component system response regulator CpxR